MHDVVIKQLYIFKYIDAPGQLGGGTPTTCNRGGSRILETKGVEVSKKRYEEVQEEAPLEIV